MNRRGWRALIPGMLVAATGVGAGDLSTSALAGSATGVHLLWAVLLGCAMKWLLTEGIARHQLARGHSVLQQALTSLPSAVRWLLAAYFAVWGFLVGAALMSANGVVLHACLPLFGDARQDKIAYGAVASLLGLALVRRGGFAWFERVMGACTAVMALAVLGCAVMLAPDWNDVLRGAFWPSVPPLAGARTWTIALMGGVGGTVTLLCYGYWIGEKERTRLADLRLCRFDLAAAYAMTALFGIGMVIVGSRLAFAGEGGGATLAVRLADQLDSVLGPLGRAGFLAGALAAVLSSLLGVWHSVPLLFADAHHGGRLDAHALVSTRAYRSAQWLLATVPMAGLYVGFAPMQRAYAIAGSLFTPLLALVLLWLLRRPELGPGRIGRAYATALAAIAAFFGVELGQTILS
ncbi:MAG: Nramp family divalent metal transporter [Planctomycetota bacterium]